MKLSDTENKLIGQWHFENGVMRKDDVTQRIEWLINNRLKKTATDTSGWDVLYTDPVDKRLWELTYPQSEMSGGGPPSLTIISMDEAVKKYPLK
jgi:hypothetical protein